MALFVKVVPKVFKNENRDVRELSTVKELGLDIIVVAKGESKENKSVEGFDVHCMDTRPFGDCKFIVKLNRIMSLLSWAWYIKKLKPDMISGHDLVGLLIGWMATCFIRKKKKALLIYDSHEFELGRFRNNKKSIFYTKIIRIIESFLLKRASLIIMVNDSIADEVKKIYGLSNKPLVVRNIPDVTLHEDELKEQEVHAFISKWEIPSDCFKVMYHGGVIAGRGIENLIKAIIDDKDLYLIVLGNGEAEYIGELKHMAKEVGVEERVRFIDAVPMDQLIKAIKVADVGMITIPNMSKSYYFMLPNKLFENIQAQTPIIGSDFPEIKKIVEEYKIGICCNPHDVIQIRQSIERMKNDSSLHREFKCNMNIAKKELCWENEKKKLKLAYEKLYNTNLNREFNN